MMTRLRSCFWLILVAVSFVCSNLFGKTEQELLQEYAKWVDMFGLEDLNTDPVRISKRWHPIYKKDAVYIRGKGLSINFDAETGELITLLNYNQLNIAAKAQDTGK